MTSKLTAAIEVRRAYQREWRSKNKDKVKEYNANYWSKKAEKDANEQKPKEG